MMRKKIQHSHPNLFHARLDSDSEEEEEGEGEGTKTVQTELLMRTSN